MFLMCGCCPIPHYEPELRELTGRDAPVAEFLRQQPEVALMRSHIEQFLAHWLDFWPKITAATSLWPLAVPGDNTARCTW